MSEVILMLSPYGFMTYTRQLYLFPSIYTKEYISFTASDLKIRTTKQDYGKAFDS
jgi:hypothetical protein